ncbi:MAG: hypothetical protein ACT4O1_15555 [Gemmatimonadota bacterium]
MLDSTVSSPISQNTRAKMELVPLGCSDVARLLPMSRSIQVVEQGFRQLGEGAAPASATLSYPTDRGVFHVKAGRLGRYFAAKLNGNFPLNPSEKGVPTIQGVVVLSDADDGRVLAIMDSIELTARRTAAATAIAARLLARADATVVTIIGCGVQSLAQLAALRYYIIYACAPNPCGNARSLSVFCELSGKKCLL